MSNLPGSASDRRAAPRRRCSRVCYAWPNGTAVGVAWGAALHDLSTVGVNLLLSCQLQPGMVLLIQPSRNSSAPPLLAQVVRVVAGEDGWLYGCVLLQPLSEADLRQWLD